MVKHALNLFLSCLQANWGRGGAGACPGGEGESRGAVVVTLESTSVSACSSGALVSKGRFVGLCLRFADDFEASLDDWQPRADDPPPNLAAVSEGTYEVCSRTAAAKHNGKTLLNIVVRLLLNETVRLPLNITVRLLLNTGKAFAKHIGTQWLNFC